MAEMLKKTTWRLLQTPAASGAWNMAVDEAILGAIGQGKALPTLRLFAWEPPCLSLGYAQSIADVDLGALQQRGWGLVRRPTGGRAILHTDELTYSVIGSPEEPRLSGGVLESYQRLASALLEALRLLGIPAVSQAQAPAAPANQKGPVCFEVPSNYEITLNGKKLIGSAQARRKDGVLQHGSLPLYGDLKRITEVLNFKAENQEAQEKLRQEAAERLERRATTIEQYLGQRITWQQAAQAFIQAFEQTLNMELVPEELSEYETACAEELVASKYGHPAWTGRA